MRSQQWATIELFLQVNRSWVQGEAIFFAVSKLFRIVIGGRKEEHLTGRRRYYDKKKKKRGEKKNWSKRPITIITENTSSTLPRDEKPVSRYSVPPLKRVSSNFACYLKFEPVKKTALFKTENLQRVTTVC